LLDDRTDPNHGCGTSATPFPSNFYFSPSSIDGLTVQNSSQGGGGIWVHGWGHELQIANNRITNNSGTLSGGINVGQGEYPPPYIQGAGNLNAGPGSCEDSPVPGAVLPYCFNVNVTIQNNYVTLNSSTGDELFSATPAGAGGVSICTGADYYEFNYNWVCGNLSTGDGGGFGHLGFSYNGDVEHNSILFNQSTNPTIPANGGGMVIIGTPDADILCNNNVAAWDGAGISLLDSPNVNIINNTVALNASTASSGVLFNTLGAPLASQQGPTCTANCGTTSRAQVAGVAAQRNSTVLTANLAATPVVCPPGHYQGTGTNAATNGACRAVSYAKLENNVIYHNTSYDIGLGQLGAGTLNQQNVVALYNATFTGTRGTAVANQTTTGACVTGTSYWDFGVRGDTGPANHSSGYTLNPTDSV